MNTRTMKRALVVAMTVMGTLTIGSTSVFGQGKADQNSDDSQGNTLVGVWQSVVTLRDCVTGAPAPTSFKGVSTYMQGGTSSEDSLDPSSPYRTPAQGIWERVAGRQYISARTYFTFSPTGVATGTVRNEGTTTLSQDFNSSDTYGMVHVFIPDGTLVHTGCYTATATRFEF
jgi:hypothetical protein